ncbi:hypothetical protein C9374_004381 [Naegleria lovaniensis]|uniref:Major facilitator superfamily (MFS) profile domain-containing protein n=1 Tax=Naegleria lovaniensis TaxID=51637 RepID=A0AA88GNJ7_NAELO|nr:uncharacterized protein C9374_004381 [Naegleria lovaniensis]KAG2383710.1 hypothetical protein C9374_004381 [Naegleria lovaniensis]
MSSSPVPMNNNNSKVSSNIGNISNTTAVSQHPPTSTTTNSSISTNAALSSYKSNLTSSHTRERNTTTSSSEETSHSSSVRILTEYNPLSSTFVIQPLNSSEKPFLDVVKEEFEHFEEEEDAASIPQQDTDSKSKTHVPEEQQGTTINMEHHHPTLDHTLSPHSDHPKQPFYKTLAYCVYYVGSGSTSSLVLGILLQNLVIQFLGETNKALNLSIIVTIATVIGSAVSPVVGNISDRIGRKTRIPIVVVATLIWALSIVLQAICSMMHTQFPKYYIFIVVIYTIVLCFGKSGYVTSQAIITAMVTDLFPQEQINLVSALVGVFTLIGTLLGVVLGGVLVSHIDLIWVCLGYATLCTLVCVPLALFHKELRKPPINQIQQAAKPAEFEDVPLNNTSNVTAGNNTNSDLTDSTPMPSPPPPKPSRFKRAIAYIMQFLIPFKNRNFTWVFVTRFTIQLTNAAAKNYFLYFIHDVLKPYNFVTDKFPTTDTEALSLFLGIVFLFTFVSALLAQKIASIIGRRFVYSGGALLVGIASIILIIFRSYTVMVFCCSILYGLGIGSFISVDLSLVNSVLISKDDSGKDLALWNISGTIPELLGVPIGGLVILIGDSIAPDIKGMGYLLLYTLGASLQVLSGFMIFCVRISRAQDTGSGAPHAISNQQLSKMNVDATLQPNHHDDNTATNNSAFSPTIEIELHDDDLHQNNPQGQTSKV